MKTKTKILIPILIAVILLSCAGGGWIWYDNNVDRSGWVEKDGVRFYRDFYADPVSGWLELEDGLYYFHEDGTPHLGWQEVDGILYFFDDSGAMHTGWLENGGEIYFFGGNGTMVEDWLWLPEGRYYLPEGKLHTGWLDMEDGRRYFDDTGIMVSGFTELEDNTYYFDPEGILATGLTEIEGSTYDFQEDGVMFTGWQETENGQRYFFENGTMALGWQEIDGQTLYFNEEGYRQFTGWLQEGEYRYYILETGEPATGPTLIDDRIHYFTPKGIEVILVNAVTPIPEDHKQTIVNVVDYHDVDAKCYDALVTMLEAMKNAGIDYTFNSAYRTWEEQTAILEYRTLEHMRDYGLTFSEARAKALETVAIPNTSEHQLGYSVDLLGKAANDWLAKHCWDYGFILRYPVGKQHITGITNEPWHFRYVGKEVSLDMKDTGLCLEEYLGAPAVTQEGIDAVHGDTWHREEFYTVDAETIAKYTGEEITETTETASG